MKKKHIPFHVINHDFNRNEMVGYDVMPYFVREYDTIKGKDKKPKTFEECREFVVSKSMYMYWSRCEYEVILADWPCAKMNRKIDVHKQLMLNIDIVTSVFMANVGLSDSINYIGNKDVNLEL